MSTVMRLELMERESNDNPIRVGVIGAGTFGGLTIYQIGRIPGISVSIISDIIEDNAIQGYVRTGYKKREIVQVSEADAANHYIEKAVPVITDSNQIVIESDVDVILEATGNPEVGARNAYSAIEHKKSIVMATVEADAVVGPLLKRMADEAGVVYSMAYGDQPALIVELYDWAISAGFEVVAAGKGNNPEWRYGTPDDSLERFGFSQRQIKRMKLNPKMYNSFLDGTKCAVEMVAVSNATRLKPDVRGMHLPVGGIRDIARLLSLKNDGGILENEGVVDAITYMHSDGRKVRNNIRWGVFVVVTTKSRYVRNILRTYGCYMGGKGRNALIYRPNHLPGLETPISLIRAALCKEPTGAPLPSTPSAEVITAAKKDLKLGDVLDGGGGYMVYGLAEKEEIAREENLLPFELAENIRVLETIPKDGIIKYDDVELNESSFLLKLRRMQDHIYRK